MNEARKEINTAYDEMKKAKQLKRRTNLAASTKILKASKIEFESKNNGLHLVVHGKYNLIDFWPSTGKFMVRGTEIVGRGVKQVLTYCN